MPKSKKYFFFLFSLFFFLPFTAFAAEFTDPLKNFCGGDAAHCLQKVLVNLVNVMLGLVGILSIAALIYGGIFYIISLGNESRVGTAKKTITWAIVGLIIVILSVLLVQFVGRALGIGDRLPVSAPPPSR